MCIPQTDAEDHNNPGPATHVLSAVRKTEDAMLERSHWWLAAAVILIGTMVPFAVSETFGIEPDAGFVFFIWCGRAAALVAAGYGIWVATKAIGGIRRSNPQTLAEGTV